MKRLLLSCSVVAFSVVTYPGDATAEILTDPQKICEAARTRKGTWFDMEGTKRCLQLDIDLSLTEQERDNYRDQVESQERELASYVEIVNVKNEQIEALDFKARALETLNADLESQLDAWYRNPWIMGGIGLAAGVAATTVVVLAISLN